MSLGEKLAITKGKRFIEVTSDKSNPAHPQKSFKKCLIGTLMPISQIESNPLLAGYKHGYNRFLSFQLLNQLMGTVSISMLNSDERFSINDPIFTIVQLVNFY